MYFQRKSSALICYSLITRSESKEVLGKDGFTTVTTKHRKQRSYVPLEQSLLQHRWKLSADEATLLVHSEEHQAPRRIAMAIKRLRKRVPATLLAFRVLTEFERLHGRRPRPSRPTVAEESGTDDEWMAEEM